MPFTAKVFGLLHSGSPWDERRSPFKSTVAAARLLKANFRMTRSWSMAITAYNSGPLRILKIPKRDRTHDRAFEQLQACEGTRFLGTAGRNYYSEFLAILVAVAYQNEFYGPAVMDPLPSVRFTRIARALTLNEIARKYDLKTSFLWKLNPEIRSVHYRLPLGYVIVLPRDKKNPALYQLSGTSKVSRSKPNS